MSRTNLKMTYRQSKTSMTPLKRNRYIAYQHRQTLVAVNDNFISRNASYSICTPLVIYTMNTFHQTAQAMKEEIMLPLTLKDMPVRGKNDYFKMAHRSS